MIPLSALEKFQEGLDELESKRSRVATELSALAAELAALDDHIEAVRRVLVKMQKDAALDTSNADRVRPNNDGQQTPRAEAKVIVNTAFVILDQAGEPMSRKAILEALAEEGVIVSGKDPLNNLSAHLSHDARFNTTKDRPGFWSLARWTRPTAPRSPTMREASRLFQGARPARPLTLTAARPSLPGDGESGAGVDGSRSYSDEDIVFEGEENEDVPF